MASEHWQRVTKLFEAALERGPEERAAFLAEACDDEEVRREVESLLAAHECDSGFLNVPVGQLLAPEEPALSPGQRFGQYEEIAPLAEGGMGQVYVAVDSRLGRKVALKLLPASHTNDAERVRRFEQEARAVSALNHPNIVTIHEVGEADSLHFIATEFVEGVTLRERMRGERMTVGEVLDVGAQVASALEAAHEAGIVHRDVKPENVMVRRDGIVKVLDFGLAKLAPQQAAAADREGPAGSTTKTNPGVVMGTVDYMSPEQARGEEVDARTDVWSLGVVLYEMVAGHTPFEGGTPNHVAVSILDGEPPPLDAEVPAELERIVSKALRKDLSGRYLTAGELAGDLRGLREALTVEARLKQFGRLDASGTTVRSTSSAEYLIDGIRRHRGRAVIASAAALLLVVSLVYLADFAGGGGEAIDSVAVLPFVNEVGDPEAEYLSDGIADGVIASLSRLPDLRVVSLSAALRYKGPQVDPQAAGRELNVRAVLTGRVTRLGDGLLVDVELVDVRDNRRLWGAQYNRKASDLVAVQAEIAGELAEKLGLRLGGPETRRLTKRSTESAEAYDAYLRGRFLLEKRATEATRKSVEYLEQAIALDPNFAPAYASLSFAYWSLGTVGGSAPKEGLPKAKAAAAKALELDDSLAEAHAVLGRIGLSYGDWAGAETAFKRAVELEPNSAFAHSMYSEYFIVMRRFDEAVAESRRAVALEPTSVLYNRNAAKNLYFARRYDEAIEQARRTLELDPNIPSAYFLIAMSYEMKGLYDEAVEAHLKTGDIAAYGPTGQDALREAYAASGWRGFWSKAIELRREQPKHAYAPPSRLATYHARLGEKDQALAWLEKAYEGHDLQMSPAADPFWDEYRSDPRFVDLIRRMGLEM